MNLTKYLSSLSPERLEYTNAFRKDWMTDDQFLCYLLIAEIMGGLNHTWGVVRNSGNGITFTFTPQYLANYDYDGLTKLVIMSHNWGVRVALLGAPAGRVKLLLSKRHGIDGDVRVGDVSERISSIYEMVERYGDL